MSGTTISSEGLDPRRRRLKFRLWHRGIREMDLVLGAFADAELAGLNDADLTEVEAWLEIPDQQMFAWVNGRLLVQGALETQVKTVWRREICMAVSRPLL